MRREHILIKATKKNPIKIENQQFEDAIITSVNTLWRNCTFFNSKLNLKHGEGESGAEFCQLYDKKGYSSINFGKEKKETKK